MFDKYEFTVTEKFLRYVQIDTQSDATSPTVPSTEKQKNLSHLLATELQKMGIADAEMDNMGYVYATIPSNSEKQVDAVCFCAHVDTSPDCSGENVKPIIHKAYNGGDIILPDDTTQILNPKNHPELANQINEDIITASGTTLLGADNKCGVAEIMDAANFFVTNPHIKHGDIKILFTPDEEIGRGADNVDIKKLGAKYGYTMDGETRGHLEIENFNADGVSINITGVAAHPGSAKGIMQNAIKIAADIIAALPRENYTPETTENRGGFIHPTGMKGNLESAEINFIIRDFELSGLQKLEELLKSKAEEVLKQYSNSQMSFTITEQYRNMKVVIDKHPHVALYAEEGIKRAGMEPYTTVIRGGTDGCRLSFMGLPCPNIFAGEHAFHGKHEWVSVKDMQLAVMTIVNICCIYEENAK